MKYYILLLCVFLGITSCQDVVDVDVPTDQARLNVDALIRVKDKNAITTAVTIKVFSSSSFFDDVKGTDVENMYLTNNTTGEQISPTKTSNGVYEITAPTSLLITDDVTLTILYNGETYEAISRFSPSVPIDKLTQGTKTLFGTDDTEVIISYTDIPDQENYYLFDFDINEYIGSEDTFYPGQPFEFSYYYDNKMIENTELEISILGIDEQFYVYMNQLILQSGGDQGPFQTPVATVKGNIVNTTNPDNIALGYFAISESYSSTIVIK